MQKTLLDDMFDNALDALDVVSLTVEEDSVDQKPKGKKSVVPGVL